jgi:DNA-binding NtrC family response regulator
MSRSVLILDPSGRALGDFRRAFEAQAQDGWAVSTVPTLGRLLRRLRENGEHHLVVMHERRGDGRRPACELVARLREVNNDVPVVIVADAGSVESAASAIQAGATDFMVLGERLPERIATLLGKLGGLFDVIDRNRQLDEQNSRLREAIGERFRIVGESPRIRQLIGRIQRVALVPRPVLIVGERGTGKELVARAIHTAGSNATRPMVLVNCAALGDSLLESELFGHEKGAFTGADAARQGKFELADGGTLFLDEIGHMSLPFQQKILRVVEYGTYARVGGSRDLTTTARVIAATNIDLKTRIREGRFLADLFDRLAFDVIEVPPLRERPKDIAVLARHFLAEFAREIPAFAGRELSREALSALERYRFPGNVRELKNIIERAAYRHTGPQITIADLGLQAADADVSDAGTFEERLDSLRKRMLIDALRDAGQNQAEAARRLGLSYHQFRYFYGKYAKA